jgi:tight adherence protein B
MHVTAGLVAAVLAVATVASATHAFAVGTRTRTTDRFDRFDRARPAPTGPGRVRAPARVRTWVHDSGAGLDVDAAWPMWLIATGGGAVVLWVVAGPGVATLFVVSVVGGPAVAVAWGVRRRWRHVGGTLPGALDEIARSLRAGASLAQAIEDAAEATAGAIGDDLKRVVAVHRAGVPLAAALAHWRSERPIPGVRLTASALELGLSAGGAHARAVDGVAATLRDNLAISAEVRAQAAQAQASAVVIGLAPLGFTALACLADHRTATFLFQTPAGLTCLAIGLTLDGLGAAWMARITRTPE